MDFIASAVSGVLGGIANIITACKSISEVDKLTITAAMQAAENELKNTLSKDAINLADAQSDKAFQSNWRPFLGWVMAGGILVVFCHSLIRSFWPDFAALDANVYTTITLLASVLFGIHGAEKGWQYHNDSKYNSPLGQKPKS